jgi:hypothetical protein
MSVLIAVVVALCRITLPDPQLSDCSFDQTKPSVNDVPFENFAPPLSSTALSRRGGSADSSFCLSSGKKILKNYFLTNLVHSQLQSNHHSSFAGQ